uniref:COX15/CtaA family protein n=1 Tax=Flavobacterium sp. TaxID=239 RepID=UPI0040489E76
KSRKFILDKTQDNGVKTLLVFVFIQFLLGIFTLLFHVPLWLGLAHHFDNVLIYLHLPLRL